MEVAIVTDAFRLLELIEHVSAERVQAEVSPRALDEINVLRERLRTKADLFPTLIDVLGLLYDCIPGPLLSLSERNALEVAVVTHEGMYNAFIRESFRVVKNLVDRPDTDQQALRALLTRLIPDPVILQAMWRNIPTESTLVHAAETQLGYLRRRSPALRELHELFSAKRSVLPIRDEDSFSRFLTSIDQLATLGEKAAVLPEPKLS